MRRGAQWDVVNEMFNENGSVRSSVFSRLFGGDVSYISYNVLGLFLISLRASSTLRSLQPAEWILMHRSLSEINIIFFALTAYRLYINDYNLDSANAKVNGMVTLVRKVNSAGPRLIDGCGTQMHLTVRLLP